MLKKIFINERVIIIAIILNAIIIFGLSFPSQERAVYLVLLDDLFIAFFVVEAIVKIAVLKPKYYFKDNWNLFDFTLILLSVPAVAANFLEIHSANYLMIFRLLRLFRLIRLAKFVPNITHLIEGVGRAFRASLLILIVLFFLNFILAIITCQLFNAAAPEYFGNPLISAYTIFQMFTIEGWNEIPPVLEQYYGNPVISAFIRLYFVAIVLIGGVFGMSLANAIFVDEMTIDNHLELERKINVLTGEIQELKSYLMQDNEKG